jgi:hypothetical protein
MHVFVFLLSKISPTLNARLTPHFMKMLYFLVALLVFNNLFAQSTRKTENIVIITIDGARWKEVFQGGDSLLLYNTKFMKKYAGMLQTKYGAASAIERRKKLMPFFWSTLEQNGQLFGNRTYSNNASVKNPYNVSYPGYSEIYTGYPDPDIKTNDLLENPNPNLFEFLSKQPAFKNKVAAFASWDRGPFIMNEKRSGFPVNGGYEAVTGDKLSDLQKSLNTMQSQSPIMVSESSRPDIFTYSHAKEYMRINHPRAISIGLAYTDDFAHDGNYGFYLEEIHAFDTMIGDLWNFIQSDNAYKNKTTMLITIDHGRGYGDEWTSHGPTILHSNEIWFAVIGPDTEAKGEMKTPADNYQYQFAQTMANFLGVTFVSTKPIGPAIKL